jgi:hypothetical protein
MGIGKELFIAAHMEFVEQYLSDHPDAEWGEAYEATADGAYDRYTEKFADMADAAKQRAKDAGNWPPKPRSAS